MKSEREKLLENFCKESKTIAEAMKKMKEYDKKHSNKKIVIDTNNKENEKFVEEHFRRLKK